MAADGTPKAAALAIGKARTVVEFIYAVMAAMPVDKWVRSLMAVGFNLADALPAVLEPLVENFRILPKVWGQAAEAAASVWVRAFESGAALAGQTEKALEYRGGQEAKGGDSTGQEMKRCEDKATLVGYSPKRKACRRISLDLSPVAFDARSSDNEDDMPAWLKVAEADQTART